MGQSHILQLVTTTLLNAEIVEELVRCRQIEDGKRVQERRRGLNLTQSQLAELTGLKKSSISRIESGTYTPRAGHKICIAAALATEVAALWIPLSVTEARSRAIELSAA